LYFACRSAVNTIFIIPHPKIRFLNFLERLGAAIYAEIKKIGKMAGPRFAVRGAFLAAESGDPAENDCGHRNAIKKVGVRPCSAMWGANPSNEAHIQKPVVADFSNPRPRSNRIGI
jgi:hypothetical protein